MFDFSHPFFKPMWRRVALVVFCFGWGIFELVLQDAVLWGVLFIAMGGVAFWMLFLDEKTKRKLDDES